MRRPLGQHRNVFARLHVRRSTNVSRITKSRNAKRCQAGQFVSEAVELGSARRSAESGRCPNERHRVFGLGPIVGRVRTNARRRRRYARRYYLNMRMARAISPPIAFGRVRGRKRSAIPPHGAKSSWVCRLHCSGRCRTTHVQLQIGRVGTATTSTVGSHQVARFQMEGECRERS